MRSKKLAGAAACALVVLVAVAVAAALGAFSSPTPAASGSRTDVIKVQGHWNIQVRQHGRLVRQASFHNEFTGATKLISVLTHQTTVGQWMIGLTPQLCGTPDAPGYCWLDEGVPGTVAQNHTVVVSSPSTGDDAGKLVLKATFTAGVDNNLQQVRAQWVDCPPSSSASAPCHENGGGTPFSSRYLSPFIPIVAGQQVLITIKYTFS
jgi:hypothetical protein